MSTRSQPGDSLAEPAGATLTCVLAGCWFALTLALVEPVQAALPNWDGLSVGFATLLSGLSGIAMLLLAVVVPLAALSARVAPVRATALWTAACVVLWLQGDIFVWDYGTFDGSSLDWTVHRSKGWLELVAWLGLSAFGLWRPEWVAKQSRRILGGVVVLQLAGLLGILQHNAPYTEKTPPPARSTTGGFSTLSSERNAIVVVLDALQSDVFAAAMRSPELAAKLPGGFVFYPDAISMYMSTQFSLQSILTSRAIPNDIDAMNWRARALGRSLPVVLGRHGFDARIASFAPEELACGVRSASLRCMHLAQLGAVGRAEAFEIERRAELSLLLRLAVFRLAPHVLKAQVYDAGEWGVPEAFPAAVVDAVDAGLPAVTRRDLAALAQLTSKVAVDDGPPRFRFIHLNSVHFPARAGADCTALRQARLRLRQIETAQCVLGELFEFFQAIDAAGAYDASLIVIVADHGSRQLAGLDSSLLAAAPEAGDGEGKGALNKWWRGVPMFAVKQPGERGALRTSKRAVSLCDVPATVFDAMGIAMPAPFACEPVRDGDAPRHSARLHYNYIETARQKRLPRALRFRYKFRPVLVDGHSWNRRSWSWCGVACQAEIAAAATPDSSASP